MTSPVQSATTWVPSSGEGGRVAAEVHAALADIAALAVSGVRGCAGAAVTLTDEGVAFTVAATSAQARAVDQAQYRHGYGPCLTALHLDQVVSCEDYTTEQRWPGVASEATAVEVASSLSVPLHDGSAVVGALNLYGRAPRAFDAESRRAAQALACHGATKLRYAERLHRQRSGRAVEYRLAETMQRMLPVLPGVVCAARYLPSGEAGQVGGDWCDLFALPDGAIALAIGDVMGHDATAAAAVGQLRSVLRSYAYSGGSPSRVLDQLDRLVQGLDLTPLATVLYGRLILDSDGALLLYGNAGHPPPLLRRPDGAVSRLTGGASRLIGAPSQGLPARSDAAVCLPIGSTLLLYTDGLLEGRVAGRRPDLDEGIDRLSKLAADLPADIGPEKLCDDVIDQLVGPGHDDDIALFALQITGQPAGTPPAAVHGQHRGGGHPAGSADRARRLAHLLADAEQESQQLWQDLAQQPGQPQGEDDCARSAWRCYSLVQDALLHGAIELAAILNVPDDQLPR